MPGSNWSWGIVMLRPFAFSSLSVLLLGYADHGVGGRSGGGARTQLGGQVRSREEKRMSEHSPPDNDPTLNQPLRVLLVEDDEVTLEFISDLLAGEGASVTEAPSVQSGVAALDAAAEPFDLLLTDYVLQDGTGVDVALAARGRVGRVVLVSGELAGVPLDAARGAGVEVFIPKFELSRERVKRLLADLFA